jgi:hypothetical protein
MIAYASQWNQVFQQIDQKIQILKNLVRPLPREEETAENERRQVNELSNVIRPAPL